MKKRFLALLLAVCILIPVSRCRPRRSTPTPPSRRCAPWACWTPPPPSRPRRWGAQVTRGEFARMLTMVSSYRETVNQEILVGSLFTDVNSSTPYAPYIRIAVQQNWLTGYTDGTFRPNDPVTWRRPAPRPCGCWATPPPT